MPTDAELKAYAGTLPTIYRDILAAFPDVDPGRKAGDGLAFQTLAAHFANQGVPHGLGEVHEACLSLAANGFFVIRNVIFSHPTDLGELLIAAVTGKHAQPRSVPELPQPTW